MSISLSSIDCDKSRTTSWGYMSSRNSAEQFVRKQDTDVIVKFQAVNKVFPTH